jgi:hypothetical protein
VVRTAARGWLCPSPLLGELVSLPNNDAGVMWCDVWGAGCFGCVGTKKSPAEAGLEGVRVSADCELFRGLGTVDCGAYRVELIAPFKLGVFLGQVDPLQEQQNRAE